MTNYKEEQIEENYLSYGGGVQSTTILMMMIEGVIEKADVVYEEE